MVEQAASRATLSPPSTSASAWSRESGMERDEQKAVQLLRREERGVSYVQASRDLGVHTSPFSSNGPFRLTTFRWPLTRAVVQTVSYCRSMAW
jgi:hypothetical protein